MHVHTKPAWLIDELHSIAPASHDQVRLEALEAVDLVGHVSKHHCLCQQSWTHCEGGLLGWGQTCTPVHDCPSEVGHCKTVEVCRGSDRDACDSALTPENVEAFPVFHEHGADPEIAAALWLHLVISQTEFELQSSTTENLDTDPLTSESSHRRQGMFDFLNVLCEHFPDDSHEVKKKLDEQAAAKAAAAEANATGRRLWWIFGGGDGKAEKFDRCRESLCDLQDRLEFAWQNWTAPIPGKHSLRIDWQRLEDDWQLCGMPWADWAVIDWHQCRGTFAGTRQLPCGLWILLHTVLGRAAHFAEKIIALKREAAEAKDAADAAIAAVKALEAQGNYSDYDIGVAEKKAEKLQHEADAAMNATKHNKEMTPGEQVTAIRTFLGEFMDCAICRKHILLAPYDPASIEDHHHAILWLWNTHNDVSKKVYLQPQLENAFALDPGFPRAMFWPSKELCPLCIKKAPSNRQVHTEEVLSYEIERCKPGECLNQDREMEWDYDAVYAFLLAFYGRNGSVDLHASSKALSIDAPLVDGPSHSRHGTVTAALAAFFLAFLPLAAFLGLRRPSGRRRVEARNPAMSIRSPQWSEKDSDSEQSAGEDSEENVGIGNPPSWA